MPGINILRSKEHYARPFRELTSLNRLVIVFPKGKQRRLEALEDSQAPFGHERPQPD
jgi:hypothetical protein